MALDWTMDQRATRAADAGATATARPANADGVRRVAPAKEDTKPIMVLRKRRVGWLVRMSSTSDGPAAVR